MAVELGSAIPWWAKIAGKIVLSRLPVRYDHWRLLGLFRHGAMLDPEYALDVFLKHHARVKPHLPESFVVLELGPGDSLATALIAHALGASATFLVDTGRFAQTHVGPYLRLSEILRLRGFAIDAPGFRSIEEMLRLTNTIYLTGGLASLASLPAAQIDFVFSQAVFEHVALDECAETVRQLARLQKPGGVASHRIDLQDHLSRGLNSLRFSRNVWESEFFAKSGFYTNRLRANQIRELFRAADYEILVCGEDRWPSPPIRWASLHPEFRHFSEDELLVRGLELVCRRRA